MDVSLTIKVDKNLLKMGAKTKRGILKALPVAALEVQKNAKKDAKFVDRSGLLRKSIAADKVNKRDLSVKVIVGEDYGVFINDGTRYIKAFRFMEKALDKAAKKIETLFKNIIGREIDR
jgi:HK97 gp10 family phage protein